ncbi:uncharacterized protein LOC142475653 [Ascaphus truei]|uniref:uncharacterized protein LOC142475653 n=1 Tax=Ascaphus truei TaxID=8439 RepID=UPI003F592598
MELPPRSVLATGSEMDAQGSSVTAFAGFAGGELPLVAEELGCIPAEAEREAVDVEVAGCRRICSENSREAHPEAGCVGAGDAGLGFAGGEIRAGPGCAGAETAEKLHVKRVGAEMARYARTNMQWVVTEGQAAVAVCTDAVGWAHARLQFDDALGRLHAELQLQDMAGEVPAELQGMAGEVPAELQLQGMAGEIPAELQGMAGEIPAELQGMEGEIPTERQLQGMLGEVPAELQGMVGEIPSELQLQGMAGEIPAERQLQGMAGEVPAELQGMAGEIPAEWQLQGMAGEMPAELQGMAGEIPAEGQLQGMAGEIPAERQLQGIAGEIPAELQGMAGEIPAERQLQDMAGEIPAERQLQGMAGEVPAELHTGGAAGEIPAELHTGGAAGEVHTQPCGISGMTLCQLTLAPWYSQPGHYQSLTPSWVSFANLCPAAPQATSRPLPHQPAESARGRPAPEKRKHRQSPSPPPAKRRPPHAARVGILPASQPRTPAAVPRVGGLWRQGGGVSAPPRLRAPPGQLLLGVGLGRPAVAGPSGGRRAHPGVGQPPGGSGQPGEQRVRVAAELRAGPGPRAVREGGGREAPRDPPLPYTG